MRQCAIALAVAAITSMPALADEDSVELATGGLIFVRNENLVMLSEDLPEVRTIKVPQVE
jgi:hypothetical protein